MARIASSGKGSVFAPGTIRAILGLSLFCSGAHANDTLVTLGAGGLVAEKSTQVVMESEDLQISVHRITVRYVFRNTTAQNVEAMVAFPLPDLEGGAVYYEPIKLPSGTQLNFVDFSVTADGKPIATEIESRAFLEGRDVTERLRAAGLPVLVLLEPLNSALMKIPPAQRKQLETEHLIAPDDFNPPLRSVGKRGWWAAWTMRVRFYWTQQFPANKSVTLTQTYRPVVGGLYYAGDDSSLSVKPYCGGEDAFRRIAQFKHQHPALGESAFWERRIEYILTTANNWSGPIRNFHLTVFSDSPEDITLTCTPGLKRIAPTRYELSESGFRPNKDLELMILQPSKPGDQ